MGRKWRKRTAIKVENDMFFLHAEARLCALCSAVCGATAETIHPITSRASKNLLPPWKGGTCTRSALATSDANQCKTLQKCPAMMSSLACLHCLLPIGTGTQPSQFAFQGATHVTAQLCTCCPCLSVPNVCGECFGAVQAIKDAEPLTQPISYSQMTNLRRLYEDIPMPGGLAVVGDSLAGFNPVRFNDSEQHSLEDQHLSLPYHDIQLRHLKWTSGCS